MGINPGASGIINTESLTGCCVAEHDRHSSPSDLWSTFEAEAMPHVDRLFRLAMWMERDRQ